MRFLLFPLLGLLLLSSCQQPPQKEGHHVLCDYEISSLEAAQAAIVQDRKEGYFEKVQALEMAIQMQLEKATNKRLDLLPHYKEMLQKDVQEFSASEQILLHKTFQSALDRIAAFAPNIKLPKMRLIKTLGSYYGASVYYTRENCIVIPADQLVNSSKLEQTLIHEIFHVYSRYSPKKRKALYAAIGYQQIDSLILSDFLQKRIFYNPDGLDLNYAIRLKDENEQEFLATPIIFSRFGAYKGIPMLQAMLFQFFELEELPQAGQYRIKSPDLGLEEKELNNYWEQIGRNTNYTIHPDEVLADNFTFLAYAASGKPIKSLGPKGRSIAEKIKAIIQE